jgi:poly[(R)-3-hydroxyalkanoate] polymerase subunit PhaC
MDSALDGIRRVQFETADILRRAQGRTLQAVGFGPDECPYRVIASGPFWLLRDYSKDSATQSVLIVAAPIKRAYIWDLAPSSSAIRYCLKEGLRVRLLEWASASRTTGANGLAEYAQAIGECFVKISGEGEGRKPFLLGTPWALASPDTFVWSRLTDAAMSIADPSARDTHARVERWALDEVPLPGKFVHQLIEWLYREDRSCRGRLRIDKFIGPQRVSAPTLAIVNTADDIAPFQSVEPFIESLATPDARIIQYPGEIGVGLQHLGLLIGRQAHARIWPAIISWMDARRQTETPFAKFCG